MADETAMETPTGDAPAEGAASEPDRVVQLARENGELKDRVLRTLAEMENLRRRTEREIADARQYAVANFARDTLTVADNLRRAIAAVPAEARAADPALANLLDGVEATERGLEHTLAKFGIRRIEPKGEKFDPAFHQAVFEVESADLTPGTVAEVVQAGYVIGERVLRPAMVVVAKAKASPQPAAANDDAPAAAEPAT
ncbi:MAG TPA: nucleotide exchange factor GrpE [Bauldia sp.]|nr:nucleotide exchange factor GrpE [Bauldia sp.]